MTPTEVGFLAVAGLLAGGVNTIAGGGSLLSFSALLAVGLPPLSANVTSKVGLLPGYLGGTIGYRRELAGQGARARVLTITALLGSALGCLLLLLTPAGVFATLVPFLVLGSCLLLAIQPRMAAWLRRGDSAGENGQRTVGMHVGVFLSGIYGAYFGAALGVLLLGILGIVLHEHIQRLNALKGYLSLVISLLATVAFSLFGPVSWVAVGVLAISSLAGGHLGASLARRLSARMLRAAVLAVGAGVAVMLFVNR